MVIRMGEFELDLDENTREYLDEQAWAALGENERLIRDTGLEFTPENLEWAKRFASRVAVYRTLVREGVILEAPLSTGLLMVGRGQ